MQRFVDEMNRVSQSLSMLSSQFVNPHGLNSANQRTTANDLAKLRIECLRYAMIMELWGLSSYELQVTRGGSNVPINIETSVLMAGDLDVIGGKTGNLVGITTNLVLAARAPNGNVMVSVVLKCATEADRFADTRAVINSVFAGHTWR